MRFKPFYKSYNYNLSMIIQADVEKAMENYPARYVETDFNSVLDGFLLFTNKNEIFSSY